MPTYRKNFLSKVVLKLDFAQPISLGNLEELKGKVFSVFPNYEEKEANSGMVEFDLQSGDVKKAIQKFSVAKFTNTTGDISFEVSPGYFLLQYNKDKYIDSKAFFEDVKISALNFLEVYKIKIINRIGLRYINEIIFPTQIQWKDYIASNLVSNLDFLNVGNKKAARVMSQIVFKEKNADLNFNYGIWNKDFPNEITRSEFVLDLDCFSRFSVESEELDTLIREYHGYIESLFERSITQKLREEMNKV